MPILTKSGAITLQVLSESKRKTPGAQLHMLTNIPVKLFDSSSNTFGAMRNTTFRDVRTEGQVQRYMHPPPLCGGIKII